MSVKKFYLADVAEHNTPENLWIVIDEKVYDVTKFLKEHPGGEDVIMDVGGMDATKDFEEVGHSNSAKEMLSNYYLGDVADADKKVNQESIVQKHRSVLIVGSALLGGILLAFVIKRIIK